ncbi:MAG TPA: FAD-dependent oxidoreductase [bacterium]|nr:FAD-dependent oxidoreductase [bacterium]
MSRIVILGAGPTGLGAATRLQELRHDNFLVLEAADKPGGLASSETTPRGFTYDIGGHVLFSHFRYFDELFDSVIQDDFQLLLREAWIWIQDRFLPYPFQNNVKDLPREALLECVLGVLRAQRNGSGGFTNFEELIQGVFGEGIAKYFMMPYNFKVWAHPPRELGTGWIGERVPVVDLEKMITNVILDRSDISWGPNNRFKYPRQGGTGGLFTRIAAPLESRIRYGARLVGLNAAKRRIQLEDGGEEEYDVLINTAPLDLLIDAMSDAPPEMHEAARWLQHSGSAIVGVGVRQPCPSAKCWIYFPEPNCNFYRVTYLSNYSPEVVPDARTHYSLLAEVSFSRHKPVTLENVVEQVIEGFVATGLLAANDLADIVDTHLIVRERTYPIPSLRRDDALAVLQPFLESKNIFSRGRFGAWKYEIGNMDHSVQMGAEVVERILHGAQEQCFHGRILPKEQQTLGLLGTHAALRNGSLHPLPARSFPTFAPKPKRTIRAPRPGSAASSGPAPLRLGRKFPEGESRR